MAVVIEHTRQPVRAQAGIIKTAAWSLDLGPGLAEDAQRQRGVRGGEIVAEGTPEDVAREPRSFAGQYLAPVLERVSEAVGQPIVRDKESAK